MNNGHLNLLSIPFGNGPKQSELIISETFSGIFIATAGCSGLVGVND